MKKYISLLLLGSALSFLPSRANAQENPHLSSSIPVSTSEVSVNKSLENILSEVILPPRNNSYSNGDRLVYNLFIYDKVNVGNMIIKENSLEFNIKAFYVYKKYASLSNENDSTHVQVEDDDTYTYKLRGGNWVLADCTDKEKKKLIKSSFLGGNPVNLLNKLLSGEYISHPRTFLFGIPYEGEEGSIFGEKDSSGYERFNIEIRKFKLFEDGRWIPLVDDPAIIFGDITALFRYNTPLIVVGKFKPYISIWGIKILPLPITNLKMIREDIVPKKAD